MKTIYYNIPKNHDNYECYVICDGNSPTHVNSAYVLQPEGNWEHIGFGWDIGLFGNHRNKQEVTREEFENVIFLAAI